MLRRMFLACVIGAATAVLVGTGAYAQNEPAQKQTVSGTIMELDEKAKAFELQSADRQTHKLTYNEQTTYASKDRQSASREEVLVKGAKVVVTHQEGKAIQVIAAD